MASAAPFLCLFLIFSVVTASPVPEGINGHPCATAAQCQGTRTCYYLPLDSPASFGPCDSREECFCGPVDITDMICHSDNDCIETGEVCTKFAGFSVSGCISLVAVNNYPQLSRTDPDEDKEEDEDEDEGDDDIMSSDLSGAISPQPTDQSIPFDAPSFSETDGIQGIAEMNQPQPSQSTQSESACIAAHHLKHLPAEQLLYDKHVAANVLCDVHGNCATPGHMVHFDGRPIMMKSYCELVHCETREALVNSPKYSQKLRVRSRSASLYFTAFSARYASRLEETLLSVAVRVGL